MMTTESNFKKSNFNPLPSTNIDKSEFSPVQNQNPGERIPRRFRRGSGEQDPKKVLDWTGFPAATPTGSSRFPETPVTPPKYPFLVDWQITGEDG